VWLHVQKNDLRDLQCPLKYSRHNKIIFKVILWELLLQDNKCKWFCSKINGKPWISGVLIFGVKDTKFVVTTEEWWKENKILKKSIGESIRV